MALKPLSLLVASSLLLAGDPPLNPDATKALSDYQRTEEAAKAEYDKRVCAAKEKAIAALQAAVAKATKSGDLDAALAA